MMEPTPEQLLKTQKGMTFPGEITYELGLEVKTASGFVAVTDRFAMVFGDNNMLAREQKRVLVPIHRIYEIRGDE